MHHHCWILACECLTKKIKTAELNEYVKHKNYETHSYIYLTLSLQILVHPSWAPLGAERFLQMVNSNYFSSKVVSRAVSLWCNFTEATLISFQLALSTPKALMRCVKNFLCQFGIAGIPSYNQPYNGRGHLLMDDKNWLPEGPTHRINELGVKRFGKGYLAYAGAGKESRVYTCFT